MRGKTKMKTNEKNFIVVWHYCANYGMNEIKANNATEAIRNHLFYGRKDIELIAFENNKETSAFKGKGMSDVINPIDAQTSYNL